MKDNGSTLECCKPDGTSLEILPKRCLPIITPHDDPGSKSQCFTVPATLDTADRGCNIKPVRQVRKTNIIIIILFFYKSLFL